MDNMVTFRYDDGDAILRLSPVARAALFEMLEMLDLDEFSMVPEDREVLAETKFQVMAAVGTPTS